MAWDSGAAPGRGRPSGPVSGRSTRAAIAAARNPSRWAVFSASVTARAKLTFPSRIASRTGPARSGSHADSHTRRWQALIGRPVATWC